MKSTPKIGAAGQLEFAVEVEKFARHVARKTR